MKTSKDTFMETVQLSREANTGTLPGESIESAAIRQSPSVQLSNSITTLRSLDAASIDTLAKAQINEVAEGLKDPIDFFSLVVKGNLYFTTMLDNLKPFVYAKTLCQKGDKYVKNGVEFTPSELGVVYDFSVCQDKEWDELDAKIKELTNQKKEREKFLKSIKGKLDIVDENYEVHTIYEPGKSGHMGYKTKTL